MKLIWHRIVVIISTLMLICSCARLDSTDADDVITRNQEEIKRTELIIKDLNKIDAYATNVISRKKVRIRYSENSGNINQPKKDILPSESMKSAIGIGTENHASLALLAFLSDAHERRTIRRTYESGCEPGDEKANGESKQSRIADLQKTARLLDAVAVIDFEPCYPNLFISPNSQTKTTLADANSKAIAAHSQKERAIALNAPFRLSDNERRALMAGQVFRFAETEDKDIFISKYVLEIANTTANAVAKIYRPFSKKDILEFTTDRIDLKLLGNNTRLGWLNALGSNGVIYVSPTYLRAAILSCTSNIEYLKSTRQRLQNEILPKLADGRMIYYDAKKLNDIAERIAASMPACLHDKLIFLLAHELSHAMLNDAETESVADCFALIVASELGAKGLGIMGETIFGFPGTDLEGALGLSINDLNEVRARKVLLDRRLESAISSISDASSSECRKPGF